MKSKVLSISAISAAFIAIVLTVGAYIELIDFLAVLLSSIFVLLPLYYGSYKGSILESLSGVVIAFLCGGLNILSLVFPTYLLFFGFYPIFRSKMTDKKVKSIYVYIIGLIWFLITCYASYFYYTLIMKGIFEGMHAWIVDNSLLFVGVIGVVFYFIFDFFIVSIRRVVNSYLYRILK